MSISHALLALMIVYVTADDICLVNCRYILCCMMLFCWVLSVWLAVEVSHVGMSHAHQQKAISLRSTDIPRNLLRNCRAEFPKLSCSLL